ncbi:hypothetical protein ACFLXN_01925 [Chloroflexota bacterium]
MRDTQNSKELVAVPVRQLTEKQQKAQQLGTSLPYDAALRHPVPRRWQVY